MDRVAVFAEDELAGAARAVGADLVGGEDLISRIQEDKGRCLRGFRACIAVPELLPIAAAKVGKILGPKGLMPSVKTKTVTVDVADCVVRIKRGWLSYHTDRSGHVHLNVGRMTFTDEVLRENILAATRAIINARPASIKKKYIKKAIVCSSMGPSVELDIVELAKQAMGVS